MTDYVYQRDDAGQWWRMEYMSMWLLKKPFDFRGIGEKVTLTEYPYYTTDTLRAKGKKMAILEDAVTLSLQDLTDQDQCLLAVMDLAQRGKVEGVGRKDSDDLVWLEEPKEEK